MGSESEVTVVRSINDELNLGKFEESESELKSNVEDEIKIGGSSSPALSKRQGLRKWRRIPRDLVKKPGYEDGDRTAVKTAAVNVNSDSGVEAVFDAAARIRHEVGHFNGGSLSLTDDHERNGGVVPGKKARGLRIQNEKSNSTLGSESQSFESVFLQGGNASVSNGRKSDMFGKHDAESSDDAGFADNKHLNDEARIVLMKSDAESDDVSLAAADNIGKQEGSVDLDPLVESVKRLHFAQTGFEREVQKLRDVEKADLLTFDDPLHEILELKDAKILKLESILNSGDVKTKLEDRLMNIIQTEVEYAVITAATKVLTEGVLNEVEADDLQQTDVSSHAKEQDEKLETKEDLKQLQNRVCKFTSCFIIMLILLLVTFYLQFFTQNVEVVLVPT
ncbi:hypothetical protein QVD17_27107 [Tagetes erecta]|uniref:WPP domain-interacting protein 1 n=1 Tax=Tagetes erecta TaxID=13708 RepID=A0AAD8KBB3_TARER|nr:hypothetical protein QVD17_27107 [Tagetes erecta]